MLNEFKKKIMKKEYISPEMLAVEFSTAASMLFNVSDGTTVGAGSSEAPGQYNDEEDEEDWEDEAPRRGRRGY